MRSSRWWFRLALMSTALVWAGPVNALASAGDFLALQRRLVELVGQQQDALVRIKAVYENDSEDQAQVVVGTGFIISRDGHVLTNASIVDGPTRVWAEHREVDYAATIVGADAPSNLALLKLDHLPEGFASIALGDPQGLPPVGTLVVRLSMPLEFGPTPDLGLVAGHESRFGSYFFPCTYLRTTVTAGPGDGGSAFLDLAGRLVGIQVGSLPEIGATYILPASAIRRLRDDMVFNGTVTYGWMGFQVREVRDRATGPHLVLDEVMPDTPAREAGLEVGDVLLEIGGFPIRKLDDLRNAMFYTRVDQYEEVAVSREEERRELSVRISARPAGEPLTVLVPATARERTSPLRGGDTSEAEAPAPPEEAEADLHPFVEPAARPPATQR